MKTIRPNPPTKDLGSDASRKELSTFLVLLMNF